MSQKKVVDTQAGPAPIDTREIFNKAANRALGGGLAGAAAMGLQVVSLMWMRTTMNYQYRHGTTTKEAFSYLYKNGGIPRFYQGIGPALLQGPLSRFGDTAANTGILTLLNAHPDTMNLPVSVKTLAASGAAASWRIVLMPIDTLKTTLQVSGKEALPALKNKINVGGLRVLYHGALAASAATFAGFYPWFLTFNSLDANLPMPDTTLGKLGRNALMGFTSSVISDTVSNSIRVVKTYRQTHTETISYPQAAKDIIAKDGYMGLFGRGLKTRILANGIQGLMFSVLWKYFDQKFQGSKEEIKKAL